MKSTLPIHFHFITKHIYLPERTKLKLFIKTLFIMEGYRAKEVHYIFCNDHYLLQLNKQYLKHNTFTDIITFPISTYGKTLTADIYISVERVRENAPIFQTNFKTELHRIIFHGALHLCGYKDKTAQQKKIIRDAEEFYLTKYFVSRETN